MNNNLAHSLRLDISSLIVKIDALILESAKNGKSKLVFDAYDYSTGVIDAAEELKSFYEANGYEVRRHYGCSTITISWFGKKGFLEKLQHEFLINFIENKLIPAIKKEAAKGKFELHQHHREYFTKEEVDEFVAHSFVIEKMALYGFETKYCIGGAYKYLW